MTNGPLRWSFLAGHCLFCMAVLMACGPRRIQLPSDAGVPFPDFAQVHAQVAMACSGVRTMTTELSLAGHAGRQRLRGRVLAGFERPASMRLEGVAPFGPPAFILAASADNAMLFLPRDERVLRNARAEQILGALTGVMLAPADVQAILTGCVVPSPKAVAGRTHANGFLSLDVGGATLYLSQDAGAWRIRAATRGDWQIEYREWQGAFPRVVRLRSTAGDVDLTATMAQVETNMDVDPAAFTVAVPPTAQPLTLEELRDTGPLRGQ